MDTVRTLRTRPRTGFRLDVVVLLAGLVMAPVFLLQRTQAGIDLLLVVGSVVFCGVVVVVGSRRRPRRRWLPWILAHSLFALTQVLFYRLSYLGLSTFPTPADGVFLLGDLFLFLAIVRLVPGPRGGRSRGLALETAVVTVSIGMLFTAFAVLPAAGSSAPLVSRLVSVAYPVVDLAVVHLLARSAGGGRRPAAFWLLAAGLSVNVAGDVSFTTLTYFGIYTAPAWVSFLWFFHYALVAAATCAPSAVRLGLRPAQGQRDVPQLRLPVLAVAAVLPMGAIVVLVAFHHDVPAEPLKLLVLAIGGVVVLMLLLARVWDLLRVVQDQAAVVERLADTDPLTGLPNRRRWDAEVARAFVAAHSTGSPVTVAIVDLDHFKAFNDAHGHDGGDDLLRAAAAAWTDALDGAFIARWGGEEFTVLLPGIGSSVAAERLRAVHSSVPGGQTCSIGVASWDGSEVPPAALARADKALYRAKAAGRNRTEVALRRDGDVHRDTRPTALETRQGTPLDVPVETPAGTPDETPAGTPAQTPAETPAETLAGTSAPGTADAFSTGA